MCPLFRCQNPKCGVIENTVLSLCSWTARKKLCSECCKTQRHWHNRFPKEKVNYDKHRKIIFMNGKFCSKCKKFKPFKDFNVDKQKKDSLRCWCRICSDSAQREINRKNYKNPQKREELLKKARKWDKKTKVLNRPITKRS